MEKKGKKTLGIRAKLVFAIVPIVLIILFSFFALSNKVITKLSKEKMEAESIAYSQDIGAWARQILAEIQIYQDAIDEGTFADDVAILDYLETTVERNEAYPVGLYMGDDSGIYLDGSGWVPGDDWVLTERDWYIDGKDNEQLAFGEPYFDSQSGDFCVSASVRMNYSPAVRVLAVDVYLDYVSQLVTEIGKSEEGNAFLVSKSSQTIIAHQDESLLACTLLDEGIDGFYKNVSARLFEENPDTIELKGDTDTYYVCMNPVENTDWLLVSYMSKNEVLKELHQLELIMIIISVIAAVVLVIVTIKLMDRVVKPVESITDVIQKVAEGDFTQNITVRGHDEIARMGDNMEAFLSQMRSTISDIQSTADWLNRQSEEHGRVSDSLTDSAGHQAQVMQTLGMMVEQLAVASEQVSEQMEQLAGIIEQTNEQGHHAKDMMKQTVVASENGKDAMERVREGMMHIEKTIDQLSKQIAETDAAMEKIGGMVDLIVDVADETNLLSLNASIEAARAGDAGRGFAVVAEQIGKLAINSGAAADDIFKLTGEIKTNMKDATAQMKISVNSVMENAHLVDETKSIFESVFEQVDEADQTVGRMVELVGQVDIFAGRMKEIAKQQSDASDQISASAQQMEDYTNTMTIESDSVAESARELEKESKSLMGRMENFRI